MSEAKQPKPFLKRGTRKYLSNATVRSLNQVPKIVDFGEGEEAGAEGGGLTNVSRKEPVDFKVEIKVNSKPPVRKEAEGKAPPKAKENKSMNEEKSAVGSSQTKKKSTGLDDYIVVKNNKKDAPRESSSREKPTPTRTSVHNEPKVSMVGLLKRQDEVPSDDEEDEQAVIEQRQPIKPPSRVVPTPSPKPQPASMAKKVINIDLEEHSEKINFNSDSQDEAPKAKNAKPARPQVFPKPVEKKKWEEEESIEEKANEQPKGPSKILQKYYKKQPQPTVNQRQEKKLTTADIPRQLKQQILNELLAQKQSDIRKKLDELKNEIQRYKKERETLQQGSKQLAKDREEFEKEMQRRRKEFQEKVNAENGKLAREKRYMKDHQTNGKVDWKVKNEVEELRSKLETAEAEKKKIKADLGREVDRLKKKVEQQQHEADILKGQIRCIQMQKLKERQPPKAEKRMPEMIRYWQDAPTSSYVSNFFEDNFTLISLDPSFYCYDSLQYYQYYLTKKDDPGELLSEDKDNSGSKIMRRYKSGKEQTEFVSKSLKESFPPPFKFTIVHHVNGDVKMILPEGIHVYYDNRNRITEWKINPDKIIHNFHQHQQIELKVRTRRGEMKEQYKNGLLNRVDNGESVRFRRTEDGQVLRLG